SSETKQAPEGACLRSGSGLELVAQTDHVDPRLDVHVHAGAHAESGVVHVGLGVNVDVADLAVDHQVVGQHVVRADLGSPAPAVGGLQVAEAGGFCLAAGVAIHEPGVVDAGAHVRLEGRLGVERVVDEAQGRRQVREAAQLQVTGDGSVLPVHIAGGGGGCQRLETYAVGHHVGEVQAELGVVAQGGLAAQVGTGQTAAVDLHARAVLVGLHGDGTGTDDDVAGLVSLGGGGGNGGREQGNAEQCFAHGILHIGSLKFWLPWYSPASRPY